MATKGFFLQCTGQVEACKIAGGDNLYCKYSFHYGPDWAVHYGVEHGVSQTSHRSSGADTSVVIWNYPVDVCFRSTNVHGWPQLVLSVYGANWKGGDGIVGYGSMHLPTTPGRHVRYLRLFTPISSSFCRKLQAWVTGNPPEFFDSKFVARTRGRDVTRVRSNGAVKVVMNVTTKHMADLGYEVPGERSADAPASPLSTTRLHPFDNGNLPQAPASEPVPRPVFAPVSRPDVGSHSLRPHDDLYGSGTRTGATAHSQVEPGPAAPTVTFAPARPAEPQAVRIPGPVNTQPHSVQRQPQPPAPAPAPAYSRSELAPAVTPAPREATHDYDATGGGGRSGGVLAPTPVALGSGPLGGGPLGPSLRGSARPLPPLSARPASSGLPPS